MRDAETFFKRVYEAVAEIPRGRVISYGALARLLGRKGAARTVGWAMRALPPGHGLPWHRVVNSRGGISLKGRSADLQRALLESEGVCFEENGSIDMKRCCWDPQNECSEVGN